MKKLLSSIILILAFFLSGCSDMENTIQDFEKGINENNYLKVAGTISETAEDYDELVNNNWSGLIDNMETWRQAGDHTFSALDVTENGSDGDVYCTLRNDLGTFDSYFMMNRESGGLFKVWKIRKWAVDTDSTSSFSNNEFRILRKIP